MFVYTWSKWAKRECDVTYNYGIQLVVFVAFVMFDSLLLKMESH